MYSKIDFQHLQRISLGVATEAVLVYFSFCGIMQQLVFLYVSPQKANQTCLCNILCNLLDIIDANNSIIVIGDTNVDFFNQTAISKLLEQRELRQLIVSVTTDNGSCIDHVYTNILSYDIISNATLRSYFSDHKPIVTYLSKTYFFYILC